jgi:hypothetical protein
METTNALDSREPIGDGPTAPDRRTRRGVRGALATAVAVLGMLLTVALPAPAASAAGSTTRPDVSACFVWGGTTYANQPAHLQVWNGSAWATMRTANTNSSGCIRFDDVAAGRYYTITGYRFFGFPNCYYYYGQAPYVLTAANDTLHRLSTPGAPTRVHGPYYVNC